MSPRGRPCAECGGTGIEPASWPPVVCAVCAGAGPVGEDKTMPGCLLMVALLLGCAIGAGMVALLHLLTGN